MANPAVFAGKLEELRAHFASDAHIEERAARWRGATPEECLAATAEQCAEAEYFLSLKSEDELERALAPAPLPADTEAMLERLQRHVKR